MKKAWMINKGGMIKGCGKMDVDMKVKDEGS